MIKRSRVRLKSTFTLPYIDACRSPTFNELSDEQVQATWPAPGGIVESEATAMCRDIIVNSTVIGESCLNSLGNHSLSDDIVRACVNDVQVWRQPSHASLDILIVLKFQKTSKVF